MNDDTWVTCPYNKAHRALKSRFQIHLTKCRENHKGQGGQKQCPYDANHIVNAVEFEFHLAECESRLSVLHFQSSDHEVKLNVPPPTRPLMIVQSQSEEDWETEVDGSCYQPLENIADRPVFIQPTGLAPAERKNFRRNERSRHQYIENKGNTWKPLNSFMNRTKSIQPVISEANEKPNRLHNNGHKIESNQSLPIIPSTSVRESPYLSNPQESFKTPASPSVWNYVDETNKKDTNISLIRSESLFEASSSTGTVPQDKPVFSYANAARKTRETHEQPRTFSSSSSSSSSRRSVAGSNKKDIENSLNRSTSSVESSSSAASMPRPKPAYNCANIAKNPKETNSIANEQPRTSVKMISSWKSVYESNQSETDSSLNRSTSSVESFSSVASIPQPRQPFNYANVAKKPTLANEQPRTFSSSSSSSSWRSVAESNKKEIESLSDRSTSSVESFSSAAFIHQTNSAFNYANAARKRKVTDPITDGQSRTFAKIISSSSAWKSVPESNKKEPGSSLNKFATHTSRDNVTKPRQAFNYANAANKYNVADPKTGKPTKTFEQMHLQLLKSFAKINFKPNMNKLQL